jgi:hypothetical protein
MNTFQKNKIKQKVFTEEVVRHIPCVARLMCLMDFLVSDGHLYLNGVWVGVNLKTNTTKTCIERCWITCRKYANYFNGNNQHN